MIAFGEYYQLQILHKKCDKKFKDNIYAGKIDFQKTRCTNLTESPLNEDLFCFYIFYLFGL